MERHVVVILFAALAAAPGCDRAGAPQRTAGAPTAGAPAAGSAPAWSTPASPGAGSLGAGAAASADAEDVPQPNRLLTTAERALLQPLFRDGIDYDRVRVINASFPFQPRGVYMTPRGHVYAPGELYREDFAAGGLRSVERAVFVHEMTHVWQHANGMDLVGQGVLEFTRHRGDYEKAYPYLLERGRDLVDYGMEQQASIVEDYYLVAVARSTPFRIENRGLSEAERDALYAAVLERFLGDARYARALSPREVADRHAAAAQRAKPGPAACKESEAEHGASHMCSWRFEPPAR